MYRHFFKRFLDFTIALIVLVCSFPVLMAVTLWIGHPRPLKTVGRKWKNWGIREWLKRAFFVQERPGKDGKIFKIIKLKTMTDDRDANGELLPDEQRLTRVGRFVRSTSIDELPQLVNVLKGEMSLIGPRPLLVEYLPYYSEREHLRHSVRPGISGWAQVHGRNTVKWDDRLEYDAYYAEHISFILDLQIFFLTCWNVLMRKDISIDSREIEPNLKEEREYRNHS